MELTPQVLRNAQFRQAFRGYDPDDVDDLLERSAVSLGQILHRLQTLEAGGAVVGEAVPPAAPVTSGEPLDTRQVDEELRRTLQLAQRTADSVVAEANEEAAAKLSSADEEASGVVSEAEAERDRVLNSARSEADRMVEDAQSFRSGLLENAEAEVAAEADELRSRIADEVEQLQGARDILRSDIEGLESHLEGRRGQLASVIDRLQAMLDDPQSLRAVDVPEPTPVELPGELIAARLARPHTAAPAPADSRLVDAAAAELGLAAPAEAAATDAGPSAAVQGPEVSLPPVPDGPFSPEPFEPAAPSGTIFDAESGLTQSNTGDLADSAAPTAAEVAANLPPAGQAVSEAASSADAAAAVDRLPRLTPSTPPVGPDASVPAAAPLPEGESVEDPPRPRSSLFEPPPATTGLDQVPLDELRSLARDIPGNTPPPAPGPVWDDAGGPPTESVPAVDDPDADPFLNELKKAVDEE
ncbi:MAG: DivIVA domain-containing protein [Actinomycetia bacterium]|nr:DivIVA domain-containing protein [Actinomycetes bacterium]